MLLRFKPILNFLNNFKLLTAIGLSVLVSSLYADVCVWRNPERTMTRIFADASDYKTITKIISHEKRAIMEDRLGESLTAGESKDWIYYEITGKKGETLGFILSDAEKGEYGVIEIIMGITLDGRIEGLYIQRSQERDKQFKSREFLDQFANKDLVDLERGIHVDDESIASRAVLFGVKKMIIFYEELAK